MSQVTDSYCERCGAHYVFGSPAPTRSLKGARVLAKGLKNFVMTDGQSLGDALDLARREDGHEDAGRAVEAFHRAFNFCMSCRQYACERCWNEKASACYTCAPDPGSELMAPEERLIGRAAAARADEEWSLDLERREESFTFEQPAEPVLDLAEPEAPASPQPRAPRQATREWRARPAVRGRGRQTEPEPWPQADLASPEPAPPAAPVSETPAAPVGGQDAWTLWPITDPIAPERTLTQDELELVEARLAETEAHEADPFAFLNEENRDAAAGASRRSRGGAGRTVETSSPPARQPDQTAEHLRETTSGAPGMEPPAASTAYPAAAGPAGRGGVGRLLGRGEAPSSGSPAPRPKHRPGKGDAPGEAWPQPTAWLDRPTVGYGHPDQTAFLSEDVEPPATLRIQPQIPAASEQTPAPDVHSGHLLGKLAVVRPGPAVELPGPFASQPSLASPPLATGPASTPPSPLSPLAPETPRAVPAEPVHGSFVGLGRSRTPAEQVQPAGHAAVPPIDRGADADASASARKSHVSWTKPDQSSHVEKVDADLPAPRPPTAVPKPATPEPWRPTEPPPSPAPSRAAEPVAGPQAVQPSAAQQADRQAAQLAAAQQAAQLAAQLAAEQAVRLAAQQTAQQAAQDAPGQPEVERADSSLNAMWSQSAQEVMNHGTVRVCRHCGLPLSTHARFCRRCGTSQVLDGPVGVSRS